VLDDELRKLPAKYRELLVACDLEGRTRRLVAEGLGIPEGTLSSRLAAARKMLGSRLARRGIAPGVLAALAPGGPLVSACEVPPALLASTVRTVCGADGTAPAFVATLANGAIRAMTLRTYLPWLAVRSPFTMPSSTASVPHHNGVLPGRRTTATRISQSAIPVSAPCRARTRAQRGAPGCGKRLSLKIPGQFVALATITGEL